MNDGIWLSITEYQRLKKLSVSTIRRYIKAGRVKWRLDNKKYLIYMTSERYSALTIGVTHDESSTLEDKLEIERLKLRLEILQDEKNDLLMLVDLYEGKNNILNNSLPEIPIG